MADQNLPTDAQLELSLADFDAAPPDGHVFAHLHKKRRIGCGDTAHEGSSDSGRQRKGSDSNSSSSSSASSASRSRDCS